MFLHILQTSMSLIASNRRSPISQGKLRLPDYYRFFACGFRLTISRLSSPRHADRLLRAEPFHSAYSRHKKEHQQYALRNSKRRLIPFWRQGMERRNFQEALRDKYETIKVQGNHGGNHVNGTPPACHVKGVAGWNSECKDNQGQYPKNDSGRNVFERKAKAGNAGQDCGCQEERSHAIKPLAAEHPEQNDQAGADANQADDYVDQGIRCQRHAEDHGGTSVAKSRFEIVRLPDTNCHL